MARPKIIDEFSGIECRHKRYEARWKERRLAQDRKEYAENPEKHRAKTKKYASENKARVLKANRDWCAENPIKLSEARKKRYANRSLHARIAGRLRSRLNNALNYCGVKKKTLTFSLIGCSEVEIKIHLEKQFLPGMSWDNFGEWHIDHKLPCISFDLQQIEQQKLCFHFTNLQPLWAIDNLKKGSKTTEDKSHSLTGH